jgi:flagellar assembly protein FliH
MSGVLIKAGDARVLTRGMYGLDLRDISRQADATLSEARAEAERIVADALQQGQEQRQAVLQEARREGYEKGLAEGRAAGQEAGLTQCRQEFADQQADLISSLTGLFEAFSARREQMYLAARRDVVVLAVAIARRLARKLTAIEEVASDAATEACAEALELVRGATDATVRIHPRDRAALQRVAEELAGSMESSRHIRLLDDASVGRGGVIVETAESTIDATIDARVERIADELVTDWRERTKALSLEE